MKKSGESLMKIATIGSGHIGGTLGMLWAAKGHEVMFSSRHPDSAEIQALVHRAGNNARIGTVHDALAFGEVILLAIPPTEVEQVLQKAGDLHGKILINSINRRDGKSAGMEVLQMAKNARVVRAFNSLTWEVLSNPQYGPINASMFITGDDPAAKEVVSQLCCDIGFDPVDTGSSANIPLIETALSQLWQMLAPQYGREYSLRLLRRDVHQDEHPI
jgi:predicted dinucleotide-binding enzyme